MRGVHPWFKYLCVFSVVVGLALVLASFAFIENGPGATFVWLLLIGGALAVGCCLIDWGVYEERSGKSAPGLSWASQFATNCCGCCGLCGWCVWMVRKGNYQARQDSGLAEPEQPEAAAAPFARVVDVSKLRI